MAFNPADFQKGRTHGEVPADQVNLYLQKEEDHFLDNILQAFHISLIESVGEAKPDSSGGIPSRFSDAIDKVIERIDKLSSSDSSQLSPGELDIVVAHVNAAIRHYEEILEGCAAQLFSEFEKMRVDKVSDETISGVEAVKDKLIGQIADCIQQIKRLEARLGQYRRAALTGVSIFARLRSWFEPVIDRAIGKKLKRIRQLVNTSFQQLQMRYTEYQQLETWAKARKKRLEGFVIFQTLSPDVRENFAEIYRLLKMQKKSHKTSDLVLEELNRLLREAITVDEAVTIFQAYSAAIKDAFFTLRRRLPSELENAANLKQTKMDCAKEIEARRTEVRALGSAASRYRDFILRTHPDPYVRARLGFSESTVGPEPETTKLLVRLVHHVEALDKKFRKLSDVIKEYDPQKKDFLALGYFDEMVEDLDRMLIEVKRPAEAVEHFDDLLEELKNVGALYHFDPYRLIGVEKVLRLALRLDKFNLLVKSRKFLEFYDIHTSIRGSIPNQEQAEGIEKMKLLNQELRDLRTSDQWRSSTARSLIHEKRENWLLEGDKVLKRLEDFVSSAKKQAPLPFDQLTGEVRERRHEVLEFLYSYRRFVQSLQDLNQSISGKCETMFERISVVEGEFLLLVSHLGRGRGPMTLKELRALDNL